MVEAEEFIMLQIGDRARLLTAPNASIQATLSDTGEAVGHAMKFGKASPLSWSRLRMLQDTKSIYSAGMSFEGVWVIVLVIAAVMAIVGFLVYHCQSRRFISDSKWDCPTPSQMYAGDLIHGRVTKDERNLRDAIKRRDLRILKEVLPSARQARAEYMKALEEWNAAWKDQVKDRAPPQVVEVMFTIQGLDYSSLTATQQHVLKDRIKRTLAIYASLPDDCVDPVQLEGGSVRVFASLSIYPFKNGSGGIETVEAALAPPALQEALEADVWSVPGIEEAIASQPSVFSFEGPFGRVRNPKPQDPVPSLEAAEALVPQLSPLRQCEGNINQAMEQVRQKVLVSDLVQQAEAHAKQEVEVAVKSAETLEEKITAEARSAEQEARRAVSETLQNLRPQIEAIAEPVRGKLAEARRAVEGSVEKTEDEAKAVLARVHQAGVEGSRAVEEAFRRANARFPGNPNASGKRQHKNPGGIRERAEKEAKAISAGIHKAETQARRAVEDVAKRAELDLGAAFETFRRAEASASRAMDDALKDTDKSVKAITTGIRQAGTDARVELEGAAAQAQTDLKRIAASIDAKEAEARKLLEETVRNAERQIQPDVEMIRRAEAEAKTLMERALAQAELDTKDITAAVFLAEGMATGKVASAMEVAREQMKEIKESVRPAAVEAAQQALSQEAQAVRKRAEAIAEVVGTAQNDAEEMLTEAVRKAEHDVAEALGSIRRAAAEAAKAAEEAAARAMEESSKAAEQDRLPEAEEMVEEGAPEAPAAADSEQSPDVPRECGPAQA